MAKPVEVSDIEARPVCDERGFAVLFDLWIDGVWVGSRRTAEHCEAWLTYLCGVEIGAASSTPW